MAIETQTGGDGLIRERLDELEGVNEHQVSGDDAATSPPDPETGTRVVIGVDGSEACGYALDLVCRMELKPPRGYDLVNVMDSVLPDGSFPTFRHQHPLAREIREREIKGAELLKTAAAKVAGEGTVVEERQEHGAPTEVLMRIAHQERASLVVVGHNRRSVFDDLALGSVARTLLRECPQHVLIAKPQPEPFREFRAVIATDDSPESERCIEAFLRLGPVGLDRLYVVTVNEITSGATAMIVNGLPHLKHKAEEWVTRGLQHDGRLLCKKLESAGFGAESLVVEGGDIPAAIAEVCDERHVSLVVVAARSHGFWDRLFNESVSEKMFAKDPRSLLLLRP